MLLQAGSFGGPAAEAPEQPGAVQVSRRQITLRDGWRVKQLDTGKPDVAALARESASPDDPRAAPHQSLRKAHSDFGSYLGARPHAVKVGVYRDVVLDLPEQAWIDDMWVRATLSRNHRSASVQVRVTIAGGQAAVRWALTDPTGREVRHGESRASTAETEFSIGLDEPKLWWPPMSGPQNLYALDVNLMAGERALDRRRIQFGIREVTPVLTDPATGEKRFRFDVNGQPIFLRGGNWVPLEGATHVWQPERGGRRRQEHG